MNRKLISLTALAAVAATSLAPAAGAAEAPAPKLDVTGAYLYLDHNDASNQDFVRVVFRTADDLPRRADGAIQAGVSIDGFSHSIGSVQRRASPSTPARPRSRATRSPPSTVSPSARARRSAARSRCASSRATARR